MEFYVDGSCRGNGGPHSEGGYGVVGFENDQLIHAYSKKNISTTNNREEIRAILYVLINFGHKNPIVYSDSAYCVNTFNSWIYSWQRNGWVKSDNKVPENLDLIHIYWQLIHQGKSIQLQKVKGHNGVLGNEIADKLATGALTPEEVLNGKYK